MALVQEYSLSHSSDLESLALINNRGGAPNDIIFNGGPFDFQQELISDKTLTDFKTIKLEPNASIVLPLLIARQGQKTTIDLPVAADQLVNFGGYRLILGIKVVKSVTAGIQQVVIEDGIVIPGGMYPFDSVDIVINQKKITHDFNTRNGHLKRLERHVETLSNLPSPFQADEMMEYLHARQDSVPILDFAQVSAGTYHCYAVSGTAPNVKFTSIKNPEHPIPINMEEAAYLFMVENAHQLTTAGDVFMVTVDLDEAFLKAAYVIPFVITKLSVEINWSHILDVLARDTDPTIAVGGYTNAIDICQFQLVSVYNTAQYLSPSAPLFDFFKKVSSVQASLNVSGFTQDKKESLLTPTYSILEMNPFQNKEFAAGLLQAVINIRGRILPEQIFIFLRRIDQIRTNLGNSDHFEWPSIKGLELNCSTLNASAYPNITGFSPFADLSAGVYDSSTYDTHIKTDKMKIQKFKLHFDYVMINDIKKANGVINSAPTIEYQYDIRHLLSGNSFLYLDLQTSVTHNPSFQSPPKIVNMDITITFATPLPKNIMLSMYGRSRALMIMQDDGSWNTSRTRGGITSVSAADLTKIKAGLEGVTLNKE